MQTFYPENFFRENNTPENIWLGQPTDKNDGRAQKFHKMMGVWRDLGDGGAKKVQHICEFFGTVETLLLYVSVFVE